MRQLLKQQSGIAVLAGVFALLLLGFSVVAAMHYIGPATTIARQGGTNKGMQGVVRRALWTFARQNYRLPCPADGTAPTNGVGTVTGTAEGIESCSISAANANIGVVPWKTLGLQPNDALDGWGRRIGYAVTTALSARTGTPYQHTTGASLSSLTDGIQVQTCTNSCSGAISKYAYALISFGADGSGAYLPSGSRLTPPASTYNEFNNTLSTPFAGTGAFNVWPAAVNSYDDFLLFETSAQICATLNGSKSGTTAPYCNASAKPLPSAAIQPTQPNKPYYAPAVALTNTDTAALAAKPTGSGITYTYSCSSGSNFCPGASNAASLANTLSFVGSGNAQIYSPGNVCATLIGNLGDVCVNDPPLGAGISIGNIFGVTGGGGDWIGPGDFNSCPECFGTFYSQNYMIPTQSLSYVFSNSYRSFAMASYLVDGGMEVQVDGYSANVCDLIGDLTAGSKNVANVGPASLQVGATVAATGIVSGTTITAISGGNLTLSAATTLTQAAVERIVVTLNIAATGNLTNGSTSVTNVNTSGMEVGDTISATGLKTGTIITAIGGTTLTIYPAATATSSGAALSVYGGSATITGTVPATSTGTAKISNYGYDCPIASGQLIDGGNNLPAGDTINTVTSGSSFTLTAAATGTQSAQPIVTMDNQIPIDGTLTTGSTTVTGVFNTFGLAVGQSLLAPGIPLYTYISAINGTTLTLSQPAYYTGSLVNMIATSWVPVSSMMLSNGPYDNINHAIPITASWSAGSPYIYNVSSTQGLSNGSPIAGYGLQPGTNISQISSTLTLSTAATASYNGTFYVTPLALPMTASLTSGSNLMTSVIAPPWLVTTQTVSGTGLPSGTTITCLPPGTSSNPCNNITLSANATSSVSGGVFSVTPLPVAVTGSVTAGSTSLTATEVPPFVNVGTAITGYGIPSGATISNVYNTLTLSASPLYTYYGTLLVMPEYTVISPISAVASGGTGLTSVNSTTGLASGQTIQGAGTPAGSVISAVPSTNTLTVSNSVQSGSSYTNYLFVADRKPITNITGTVTSGSTSVTAVSPAAGLALLSSGISITGPNIQPGTTISAISGTTLTLSKTASGSATGNPLYFAGVVTGITGNLIAGSTTVSSVSPSTGLTGDGTQFLASPGVLSSTAISAASFSYPSITLTAAATVTQTAGSFSVASGSFTITGSTTSGSKTMTNVTSPTLLVDQEAISGAGIIPSGTLISNPSTAPSGSLTLSQPVTATIANAPLIAGYTPPSTVTSLTVNQDFSGTMASLTQPVVPQYGQQITGRGFNPGTFVTAITGGTGNTNTITLNQSGNGTTPAGDALFATYPACPGPSTANGGIYQANPTTPQTVATYAPIQQHPSASQITANNIKSQIWPQPTGTRNQLSGNYIDQRDNQFTNRQFTSPSGTALTFNVLVFQTMPYIFHDTTQTCTGAIGSLGASTAYCPYGHVAMFPYGQLFEGAKGCFTDASTADCAFTPGYDEWANPPVTVTQDCGQRP